MNDDINIFLEKLIDFFKGDDCSFPEFFKSFESTIILIKDVFNEGKITVNLENRVFESLNIVEDIYLEYKLNQKNIDVILQYLLLVFNTNSNFIKSESINKRVTFLDRCFNNLITTIDAISVMRSMVVKMKQYSKYGMPSIELSRLYVESME